MFGRVAVGDNLDRVRLSQPIEADKQANALPARQFGLGRPPAEEQPIEFAIAEEDIQFVRSYVNQNSTINQTCIDKNRGQEKYSTR